MTRTSSKGPFIIYKVWGLVGFRGGHAKKYGSKGGAAENTCMVFKGPSHSKYYLIDNFHSSAKVLP